MQCVERFTFFVLSKSSNQPEVYGLRPTGTVRWWKLDIKSRFALVQSAGKSVQFSSERLAEILVRFVLFFLFPSVGTSPVHLTGCKSSRNFTLGRNVLVRRPWKRERMRVKLVFWRFATMAFIVQTPYKQGYESHYQWSKLHPACVAKWTKAESVLVLFWNKLKPRKICSTCLNLFFH